MSLASILRRRRREARAAERATDPPYSHRLLTTGFVLGIGVMGFIACDDGPPKVWVPLTAGPIELGAEPAVLRPSKALRADNHIVGVCAHIAPDDVDWPAWRAEAVLLNGSTVALDGQARMTDLVCLETVGPLPSSVVELRIWADRPLKATAVEWMSTDK